MHPGDGTPQEIPLMRSVLGARFTVPTVVLLLTGSAFANQPTAVAPEFKTARDLAYRSCSQAPNQPPAAEAAACRLDLHYPADPGFATVVWLHGGGLTKGTKEIPRALREQGFAVAGAGYRLSPAVQARECIADAAAAVAWVLRTIPEYGGDPAKVYVSGHSAGGYLASMVGIDERWLAAEGLDFRSLAGVIPYSGQMITHFVIRGERGIPDTRPLVDDFAPLYHVRKDAPPFLLITGDRTQEMLGRYEENAYFWRMLRVVGHHRAELVEIQGADHSTMVGPAHARLIEYLENCEKDE